MANQTGRPVAPARKLVAAVMGTIAVFVMALGLGMSSWGVVIFGLALLALSIALGMVNVVRRGARAWVTGTAEVRTISPRPTSSAVYGRAEIQAVVVAPGLPTSEVTIREPRVPVVKWPGPGDTLPITVDVDDMRRVRISWDEASPRERGEDPPPPPATTYEDVSDDLGTDLLGDVEPPPWVTGDRPWQGPADEPPPPPPPPGPSDEEIPVVVRDTPAGPVVEGRLVGRDGTHPLVPQRAAPASTTGAPSAPPTARPAATRPSPHPRGGTATATAEPDTATYTGAGPQADEEPVTAAPPPSQRTPHPDDALPVDLPPDEPGLPGDATPAPTTPAPTTPAPTTPAPTTPAPTTPASTTTPAFTPPASTTPASTATATPSPVRSSPTAPTAVTPPTAGPHRGAAERHDDIDLPLDGDPDPAPERSAAAADALADDLIAPPVEKTEQETVHSTRFVSNAAHDAVTGRAPASEASPPEAHEPEPASPRGGVMAGAAAAVGAVAAAAVAAVKRVGRSDKERVGRSDNERPESPTEIDSAAEPATEATPPPTARAEADEPDADPWSGLPGFAVPDDHADDLITAYPTARPGPAGAIHGIGITILVTDLARSTAFYRDTLGFYEIDSGDGSAVLASGDTRLVLRTAHGLSAEAGRPIHLNLEVGDVTAVYAELRAKGITFVHAPRPVNRGGRLELWSATFRDPDDHHIAITQWRAVRQEG